MARSDAMGGIGGGLGKFTELRQRLLQRRTVVLPGCARNGVGAVARRQTFEALTQRKPQSPH